MTPIIPDAPWVANLILVALALIVTSAATVWVAQIGHRRKLDEIKEQVSNDHPTNLRDDIDRLTVAIQETRDTLAHMMRADESHARFLQDLDRSLRAVTHSQDRRTTLQEQALREAIEDRKREVPAQIQAAIAQHIADCPLRNPKE